MLATSPLPQDPAINTPLPSKEDKMLATNIHALRPAPQVSQVVITAYGEAPAPFCFLPRGIIREAPALGITPSMLVVLCGLKSRTFRDSARLASAPPGGLHRFLDLARSTVCIALDKLIALGIIERVTVDGREGWRLLEETTMLDMAEASAVAAGRDKVRPGRPAWREQNSYPVRLELDGNGLSAKDRFMIMVLASYIDPKTDEAYPSANTLADLLGITKRNALKHLASLKQAGRIQRGHRGWRILPAPPVRKSTPKADLSKTDTQGLPGEVSKTDTPPVRKPTPKESVRKPTPEERYNDKEGRVGTREAAETPPAKPAPAERPPSTPSFYDRMVDELDIYPPMADAIWREWQLSPHFLCNRQKVRDPIDFLKDPDKRQRVIDMHYRDRQFSDRPKPVQRCRITLSPDGTVIAADRRYWLTAIRTGRLSEDEFSRCRAFGWGRDEDWALNPRARAEAERAAREQQAAERAEAEARGDAPWLRK